MKKKRCWDCKSIREKLVPEELDVDYICGISGNELDNSFSEIPKDCPKPRKP